MSVRKKTKREGKNQKKKQKAWNSQKSLASLTFLTLPNYLASRTPPLKGSGSDVSLWPLVTAPFFTWEDHCDREVFLFSRLARMCMAPKLSAERSKLLVL